ncbi:MAG: hypothetical protein COA57_07120 [Flavobacteriales bacterium]|nr:MAG: hypothetical protein COA57_07120 [Flavobacteriales bacterium]
MKNYLWSIFLLAVISCGGPSQQNEPDAMGWTESRANDLLNECLLRYKKEDSEDKIIDVTDYCECMSNKIKISVSWSAHQTPSESTVKMYEEFSKICHELTSVEKESS